MLQRKQLILFFVLCFPYPYVESYFVPALFWFVVVVFHFQQNSCCFFSKTLKEISVSGMVSNSWLFSEPVCWKSAAVATTRLLNLAAKMPFGVVFQVVWFPQGEFGDPGTCMYVGQEGDLGQQMEGRSQWLRFKTLRWPHNHTKILFWKVCPLTSGSPQQQQKWAGVSPVAGSAPLE